MNISPVQPARALAHWVAALPPAVFSAVMATGIIGYGLGLAGQGLLGQLFSGTAAILLVLLLAVLCMRAIRHASALRKDFVNPAVTFGFFTVAAAANVVSLDLGTIGFTGLSLVAAALGSLVWLLLCYAVPSLLVLVERPEPVIAHANGSWFLWVVATQSVAGALAQHAGLFSLSSSLALGFWMLGCIFYLLIATLVTLRMMRYPNRPESLSPTYWIFMGATAITVLTGSQLLGVVNEGKLESWLFGVIAFTCFGLLSLGLWFIPLLMIFGYWRHMVRKHPLRYETGLWAIVFPLGMLSSCCMSMGINADLGPLATFGSALIWVAVLAWFCTAALWLGMLLRKT